MMPIDLNRMARNLRRSRKTKRERKRSACRAASVLFSFLLSLLLLSGSLLCVVKTGVSREGVLGLLDDSYDAILLQELQTDAQDYTLPTGIDTAVLENAFSGEELASDVADAVSAVYSGQTFTPDTGALETRLRENFQRVYQGHDLELSELNAAIDAYCEDISALYSDALNIPLADLLVRTDRLLGRYFALGLGAVAVLSLLLSVVCVLLHHYPHRGLRYCCYATGGAALMLAVAPGAVWLSGVYRRVNLTPQSFHHLVVALEESLLRRSCLAALFWLAVTVVLVVVIAIRRRGLMKPKHHHETHQ